MCFSHLLAVLSEARLAQRLTPWWWGHLEGKMVAHLGGQISESKGPAWRIIPVSK